MNIMKELEKIEGQLATMMPGLNMLKAIKNDGELVERIKIAASEVENAEFTLVYLKKDLLVAALLATPVGDRYVGKIGKKSFWIKKTDFTVVEYHGGGWLKDSTSWRTTSVREFGEVVLLKTRESFTYILDLILPILLKKMEETSVASAADLSHLLRMVEQINMTCSKLKTS